MLAGLLIAALAAAFLSTAVLLVPIPLAVGRSVGAWPWSRRLLLAVLGTVVVDGVACGVLIAIGGTRRNVITAAVVTAVASVIWLPVTRRWNARGHLCWSATVFLFAAYLAFMLQWSVGSGLPAATEAGGVLLWVLEVFAAVLGTAYLWELCDALASEHWRRRIPYGAETGEQGGPLPFVSLHVPAHNEPPDMVIDTLTRLLALDYPAYEVVVIDDNTDDEALWRPVERWCAEHSVTFAHLADWPGYKSGALNYALRELTDPRAELIGVVDSDYQLEPHFLRRCAPLFAEPRLGFIQAPQDYRDWDSAPYYRRLYYSYAYFFAVSQPSRNERDGAIFAGTMGLIRRRALEEVGGWDEWCITEDAELSLRLLRAGWSGRHVDSSFGRGVMPLTFEALKGQRFRWCFGGIQILRRNWRWLLPGRRSLQNQMGFGQRWAYLSGALQWYGDLLGLVFFVFLLAGAVNIGVGGGLLFRKLSGFLLATIPLLVAIGLVRAVALLRRSTDASWRDALGAFMIWQSTSLVTARASVQALYAKEAEFLVTPKTAEEGRFWDAIAGNRAETALAVLGTAGIAISLTHPFGYAGPLTAALLLWPTIAYVAAPLNSLAAQRAALPADLRERRRTEFLRMGTAGRLTAAAGGLVLAGAAAVVVVALLLPGSADVHGPQVVGPVRGSQPYARATPAAPGATPTGGSSTAPSTPGGSGSASTSGTATSRPTSGTASPSTSASASASPSASPSGTASPSPTTSPSPSASATNAAASPTAPASTSPAASPSPRRSASPTPSP